MSGRVVTVGNCHLMHDDCMQVMRRYPDKAFDLAIVDPPYGIGEDGKKNHSRDKLARARRYTPKAWDRAVPDESYFRELRRVSRHQIIWGGNYFALPPSPCWIVWDKDNSGDFADCELAWSSFRSSVRKFRWRWNGMIQEDMANKEVRIHPTQKPVALYRWLLAMYARPGWSILDTHCGSGSVAIACQEAGMTLVGVERDEEYFAGMVERVEKDFLG